MILFYNLARSESKQKDQNDKLEIDIPGHLAEPADPHKRNNTTFYNGHGRSSSRVRSVSGRRGHRSSAACSPAFL